MLTKREKRVQAELFARLPKKEQRRLNAERRGTWNGLNPVTRVVPSGKLYNRAKAKAEARQQTQTRSAGDKDIQK